MFTLRIVLYVLTCLITFAFCFGAVIYAPTAPVPWLLSAAIAIIVAFAVTLYPDRQPRMPCNMMCVI